MRPFKENTLTQLEKSTIVKTIVAKNPEPDQSLCPELIIHRLKGEGREYFHTRENKVYLFQSRYTWKYQNEVLVNRSNDQYKADYILYTSGERRYAQYAVCHKAFNAVSDEEPTRVLELAVVKVDGRKTAKDRTWKFADNSDFYGLTENRLFIFENDKTVFNQHGEVYRPDMVLSSRNNKAFIKDFCHAFQNSGVCETKFSYEALIEFFNVNAENRRWIYLRNLYKRIQTKPWSPKKPNPAKEKMDELGLMGMDNAELVDGAIIGVVDDHIVIRIRTDYNAPKREKLRIVINPNGKCGLYNYYWGPARTPKQIVSVGIGKMNEIVGLDNLKAIKRTEYLYPIISKIDSNRHKIYFLVNALRHPIIEQLATGGAPKLAEYLSDYGDIHKTLNELFGCEEKKVPLLKNLTINKKQLEVLDEYFELEPNTWGGLRLKSAWPPYILPAAQMLAGGVQRFLSMDEPTSREYFKMAELALESQLIQKRWRYREGYVLSARNNLTVDDVIKILRACKYDKQTLNLYIDLLRIYGQLNADYKPNIDFSKLDSPRKINQVHDNLVEILARQTKELQDKRNATLVDAFKKLHKKNAEKWEKKGDEFIIKYPSAPGEISAEGVALGHCVGGYVNEIANGYTEIIFLRRKERPDIPFYTIEVRNGTLSQIHGAGNKWLGCNPEAISFVKEWLEEKKVNYTKDKLLCTSTGYCYGHEMLDGAPYGL